MMKFARFYTISFKQKSNPFILQIRLRKCFYVMFLNSDQLTTLFYIHSLHKDSEKKPEGLASDNKARKLMYQRVSIADVE